MKNEEITLLYLNKSIRIQIYIYTSIFMNTWWLNTMDNKIRSQMSREFLFIPQFFLTTNNKGLYILLKIRKLLINFGVSIHFQDFVLKYKSFICIVIFRHVSQFQ